MPGLKRKIASVEETNGASSSDRPSTRQRSQSESPALSDDDSSRSEMDESLSRAPSVVDRRLVDNAPVHEPAENGIIESVTCTNFMCHSFLHVDIGPQINFIIGHNGSGKSAVLTALSICLGGKASATNRGGNLKSFIKEGQDSCTVSVKIKNNGATAYQPENFGPSIVVERFFSRTGTSTFRLKSSSGKLISVRRSDLDDISDYFALQMDNPISILSQDMARSFLSNSTADDKYKFFIRGVQLEQLHNDYQLLGESIETITSSLENGADRLNLLKDRARDAKRLFDLVNQHDGMHTQRQSLCLQMAWSQVEAQERELEKIETELEQIPDVIAQAEREQETASKEFEDADAAVGQADSRKNAAIEAHASVENDMAQLRDTHEDILAEIQTAQKDERTATLDRERAKATLERCEGDIAVEQRRVEELHGGKRAGDEAALAATNQRLEQLEKQNEMQRDIRCTALKEKEEADTQVEELETRIQSLERDCNNSRSLLRNLREEPQRRLGYPPNMEKLTQAIGQSRDFTEKPIGPIGNFIQLKRPLWLGILERFFGSALNGFIVTSKRDQSLLSNVMKRTRCNAPIFIGSHATFDFSNNEPDSRFETVLRVLDIKNSLVLRQLIINNSIEQTLLIENMSEARKVMNTSRLPNVRSCLSFQPRRNMGMRFQYGNSGNLQSTSVEFYNGSPRLTIEKNDEITFHENEIQRIATRVREQRDVLASAQNVRDGKLDAYNQADRTLSGFKRDHDNTQKERDDLQDAIEGDAPEAGRLEALEATLQRAQNELHRFERTCQDLTESKENIKSKQDQNDVEIRALQARVADAQSQVTQLDRSVQGAKTHRREKLAKKNEAVVNLDEARKQLQELQKQRDEQAHTVQSFNAQASACGPRLPIPAGETVVTIENKIQKVSEAIQKAEERLGADRDIIAAEYSRHQKAADDAEAQSQQDQTLLQLLKQTHYDRNTRWEQFQKHITARARVMFIHLLSERGFHGRLRIDHKQRLLDLKVQPDETQTDRQGRQAKALSGGEKSYAQICLLLALWEAIGAPIRCLDEFMRLLIRAARQSPGRQFILITPQSMASVNREADVKIIKMRDPERNQGVLNFASTSASVAASA